MGSRFASDIIIRGFDTPCKIGFYDGRRNKFSLDNLKLGSAIFGFGTILLAAFALTAGTEAALVTAGAEAVLGVETVEVIGAWFAEQSAVVQEMINSISG